MRKRAPWSTEQKELEEKGCKFNDRGEILESPILPFVTIQEIIKKQESKPIVVKKLTKKEKRRK